MGGPTESLEVPTSLLNHVTVGERVVLPAKVTENDVRCILFVARGLD